MSGGSSERGPTNFSLGFSAKGYHERPVPKSKVLFLDLSTTVEGVVRRLLASVLVTSRLRTGSFERVPAQVFEDGVADIERMTRRAFSSSALR